MIYEAGMHLVQSILGVWRPFALLMGICTCSILRFAGKGTGRHCAVRSVDVKSM
jgi:hypothetical protein